MVALPLSYSVLAQGRIERPRLSPGGTAVAWTQDVGGQQDVFVASAGSIHRVTETPENEGFALVSDDAATVAFTRRSASNIWRLHVQRDGQEGVLEDGGHHVQSATLSADGSQVAWENYGRISRTDPSSVLVQPFHGDHDERQLKPQLSGDGATLVYQVSDLDSAESHLVLESGGAVVAEIENNTDAAIAVSFDGSKVVYPTTEERGFHDLAMLDTATGVTMVVAAAAEADEAQPSVAANGDIVYQLTRYDSDAKPVRSLVHRSAAGGVAEIVAADSQWEPSLPQLSADGKTLLWLATLKSDENVRQIRTAGLCASGQASPPPSF